MINVIRFINFYRLKIIRLIRIYEPIIGRFVRVYTPLILFISTLLNAICFIINKEPYIIYLFANISGSSILVDLRLFFTSRHMCKLYKRNIICLFFIHLSGFLYNVFHIKETLYAYSVFVLSIISIIFFLIFYKKYKVLCD